MTVLRAVTLAATLAASAFVITSPASGQTPCVVAGSGHVHGVLMNGQCVPIDSHNGDGSGAPVVPTKTIDCGRRISKENDLWDERCGPLRVCQSKNGTIKDAYATLVEKNGRWVLSAVWCPTNTTPVPPRQAIRDQVVRLLPTVAIGSAWTHRALVNAQTILWADTAAHRPLRTVSVVGQQVRLRISFATAQWRFGDRATATTTTPGRQYDPSRPCNTAQCPGYFGHTYRDTGTVTLTLRVSWQAQYSLTNGTTWTDVTRAPLTGPAATHRLRIEQARGILVH